MRDEHLLKLPFDQYQRYKVLQEIASIIKVEAGVGRLRVLDVGGRTYSEMRQGEIHPPVKEFLPEDEIDSIDMRDDRLTTDVEADGHLAIKENSYDLVYSQEALERVGASKIEGFLKTLLRASKDYVVIGCPCSSEQTDLAEKIVYEFSRLHLNGSHPRELVENGLPKADAVELFLRRNGLSYCKFPSGYIGSWLVMNLVKVYIASSPEGAELNRMLNKFYNMNFYETDQREPSCRYVFVIDKTGKHEQTLKAIGAKFSEYRSRYPHESFEQVESLRRKVQDLQQSSQETQDSLQKTQQKLQRAEEELEETEEELLTAQEALQETQTQQQALSRTLSQIYHSRGWRLLGIYYRLKFKIQTILFFIRKGVNALRIEGPVGFVKKVIHYRKYKQKQTQTVNQEYATWLSKNQTTQRDILRMRRQVRKLAYRPLISIIMPVYNTDRAWLEQAIQSVVDQIYPHWELCIADDGSTKSHVKEVLQRYAQQDARIKVTFLPKNTGISVASNHALSLASGEFVGLLDHDDKLSVDALYEVVKLLQSHPDADMIYSDEDKIALDGQRCDPFFKPDWSPDMFFCYMYTCHFGVYRKKVIDEIGGFRAGYEGSQDYDLVLRFVEKSSRILHIPKILYHWRKVPGSTADDNNAKGNIPHLAAKRAIEEALTRRGIEGVVQDGLAQGTYRVKRRIRGSPLVSIIIPTRDRVDLLKQCIASIDRTEYKNLEVIIVDNNSTEPETKNYFSSLSHTVLPYTEVFNFSAINNYASKRAKGDYLIFMNNDIEIISGEWLSAMLEHAQRKEVGAVGAKLLYPDNRIQHAGIILGIGGVAGHSHKYSQNGYHGYFSQIDIIRNFSAVTAACLMVRKEVFEEVNGFDEDLRVAFNDVDLCLRIRQRGYLIVYTPYALLYHHESATRGFDPIVRVKEFAQEIGYMKKKWGNLLENDPYYSPNLTLYREDFSLRI